jgi:signal transduction histidine kinase
MQGTSARHGNGKASEACPTPPRFAGEMLSVLSDIMSVEHVDTVLQKIADEIADLFSMRALVIGVLDQNENLYRVRATHGYSADRDKKIKKFTYTQERLSLDLEEKYKVAEDVYIVRPDPGKLIKGEEAFYSDLASANKPRTESSVWHELDYIRFVIRNRNKEPIGFIEINESQSNRIPEVATIEAMRIFSELAEVAIENATMYQRQVEHSQRMRFLSDMIAHDINNYNQAVTSYLQMALDSKGVPERAAEYLQRASVSAWGISELIQRANKLAKIEAEGGQNLGPLELVEVLKESIQEVSRDDHGRDVKFDLKMDNHRYFVKGNELANEIFTNILENAVKYDPHEKVVVDISIGEFTIEPRKYWCVSIADYGIGISDSKKNLVFGRSLEGDERLPASGLGLSIVRAIVEAYRGLVWVEDRVPGDHSKGSVFRVALPMAPAK